PGNTPHRVVFRVFRDLPKRLISFPPALVCVCLRWDSDFPHRASHNFRRSFPQIVSADRSAERYPYGCKNRDDLDSTL
ncbi:MAG: hypothetical protein ACC649_00300, partial [Myxococcota bacterium]